MQEKRSGEIYRELITFIEQDLQGERKLANRRFVNVILWCFVLPVVFSLLLFILMKANVLPRSWRGFLDWTILIFPVAYSLYVLGFEVLTELPSTVRKGGIANSLNRGVRENIWRERVCESMRKFSGSSLASWDWVVTSFEADLQKILDRTRYLTALAGVVFFLLIQGIDSLGGFESREVFFRTSSGFVQSSMSSFSQFALLGLFLLLVYLSGSQTHQALRRYLTCARLILVELNSKD